MPVLFPLRMLKHAKEQKWKKEVTLIDIMSSFDHLLMKILNNKIDYNFGHKCICAFNLELIEIFF